MRVEYIDAVQTWIGRQACDGDDVAVVEKNDANELNADVERRDTVLRDATGKEET